MFDAGLSHPLQIKGHFHNVVDGVHGRNATGRLSLGGVCGSLVLARRHAFLRACWLLTVPHESSLNRYFHSVSGRNPMEPRRFAACSVRTNAGAWEARVAEFDPTLLPLTRGFQGRGGLPSSLRKRGTSWTVDFPVASSVWPSALVAPRSGADMGWLCGQASSCGCSAKGNFMG